MDEGLRLARLVSHDRVGRLSPCVPAKPPLAGEAASSAVPKHPSSSGPQVGPHFLGSEGGRRDTAVRTVGGAPASQTLSRGKLLLGCFQLGGSDPCGDL